MTTSTSVAATVPQPISKLSEEELAKSIKDKISMMLTSFRSSVTHAMEVGDLLIEAKKRVGHGNFEAWLSTHCQLKFRTARRYMKMAKDRDKIEAQLTVKSATLADLNAQRLLTSQSGGGGGGGGGGNNPTRTPAGEYDQLEEKLIDKLKELDPSEARDHADKTIAALNDTVADIASIAKRAATRLHVRTLAATLPMRPDQCVILVTAAGTGGNTLTPSHDLVPLVVARAGARFVPKPSLRWPALRDARLLGLRNLTLPPSPLPLQSTQAAP